ncbi:hypothetical protein QBC40DRAFT_345488 [Triangularia verruculosa]|uniref:Uncharacterized protein n=1 Tax=Triangularia verruculosa TaxID=2587418 RepID=A0AAN7AZQ7_9PEZI|nr:hypothetical protein QBC40DRAFT_345488 [Triangularia verruculosa]
MLDENLPTFRFKPSSDDPLSTILYFTQNGSEPSPEYLLRKPDPALPASRNKYGVGLCDPYNQNVVYGEVTIEPEWTLPTLSAAEIRAQVQSGAPPAPTTAIIPDNFSIQLYDPDQTIAVKMVEGSWNKSDSWEFEIPVQTFKTPTTSELDREQQNSSPAAADLIPRIMFRWKKEGKLSKDMTCYMSGKTTAGKKSKEPDITVAMYKGSRESAMTLYQPNLHRVEVEDRKGLELVLLLGAEVIKDLYLSPKPGLFNVSATSPGPIPNPQKRKNSRPNVAAAAVPAPAVTPPAAMSGALNNAPPSKSNTMPTSSKPQQQPAPVPTTANNIPPPPPGGPKQAVTFTSTPTASIEAETRRLQELVEREQREREKAERAEQKRIKKMLEEEEKAQRKREAEIAKETERLRKKYGVEGQDLPSDRPALPPRPPSVQTSPSVAQQPFFAPPPAQQQQQQPHWLGAPAPALPPRPVSAGPGSGPNGAQQQGPFHCNRLNVLWKGAGQQLEQVRSQVESRMSPELQAKLSQTLPHRPGGGKKEGEDSGRRRVQRKRSSGF